MTTQASEVPTRESEFGDFLRCQREERNIHLVEVARVTRIPMRSLERLEAGDFDRLPADIFVRGFLRSYADCIGLEEDDVLDRYTDLGRKPPTLKTDLAKAARRKRESREDPTLLPTPGASEDEKSEQKKRRAIFPQLSDSERESRRGPVTVAVIILVVIATLAMSYLLRRPSADSDGFTHAPPVTETTRDLVG